MNEEQVNRLIAIIGKFIKHEGLSPTRVQATFSPKTTVVTLEKLPDVKDEDRKIVD